MAVACVLAVALSILGAMLPLSLRVKNFLSYREDAPTLHLEDVHVACLCGPNGHGKSALLDAVTWALWGKARGRTHEQLIHEGQQEMAVELEFEEEGQHYRVVRRYSRARKAGQSSLELAVASQEDWRPITGDTVRQTEAAIERLVNMDYDTFINSAYLVQGRADLFTMATPAQRKNVLSSVLGLGLYDRLSERAKQHARDAQAGLDLGDELLRRLEAQVAGRAEVETLLATVSGDLSKAEETSAAIEAELELIRQQVAHLERRRGETAELATQVQRVELRKAQAAQEASDIGQRLEGWRGAVERAAQIEQGYGALQQARASLAQLSVAAQSVNALERELSPLAQIVSAARAQLETEVANQERRVTQELTPRADALASLDARLGDASGGLGELDRAAAELAADVERYQKTALEAKRIEAENVTLKAEGQATRGKLEMLVKDGRSDDVACPLCGTALGNDGREHLEAAYQQQIDEQLSRFAAQAAKVQEFAGQAKTVETALAERQGTLDVRRRGLEEERARLSVQRDEAMTAQSQLDQARAVLAESRSRLEQEAYAPEEQARVAELRQQVAALAFDTHALDAVRDQARDLEPWEEEHRRLAEARSRAADDEASLTAANARVDEAVQELERVGEQRAQIGRELEHLPPLQERQRTVEAKQGPAVQARDELQARRGSLAHQLDQIAGASAELKERQVERLGLVTEVATQTELGIAFGRGGVQALLIEAAIPRLEDEANSLLSRMSDGRMALQLHTQRDRRMAKNDEDPIETLEITINDELGMRPYELFSGGERFRVDLALRIALSKLLAWRAGARLPTLFIDEGFGTQDAEGRDRIIDVIKAIEDRFQRILVITHMEEVKEAFPVRIEVSRTAGAGSTFTMS